MFLNVIKNRNIAYYLLSAGISSFGNVFSGLAFLFLAYEITGSGLYTTGIAISQAAPYLLFGLVGGVIADWANKKSLLIWIDLIRVPIIFSLVIFHYLEIITYLYLLVVSFIIQCLGCFFNPAHRAILPNITKEEERAATNSLLDSLTRGIQVLSPILSVTIMNTFGVIHFFTIDALAYLLSALFIRRVTINEVVINKEEKKITNIFTSIIEFLAWVKNEGTVKVLFLVTFIMVFANTWVWQVGLLLQLIETVPKGKEWYSILLGSYGGAVVLTNLFIPFFWRKLTLKIYLFGSLIWGIGILMLGFAGQLPLYFIGVFIVAIGMPIASLSRVYILQKFVPADKLGRGFSFNAVLLYFSNVVSLGIFGFLSSYFSSSFLFKACGGIMIIVACIYFLNIFRKAPGVMPYSRLKS